jgi:hypothetical protein
MQGCGDAPSIVLGTPVVTAIFELGRQRLLTKVAQRPLASAVRGHKAVGVRVHEHQARIEPAEPQLAGERVGREGSCLCQGPEYVIKRDQSLGHLAFCHLSRIRRRAADR